MTPRIPAPGRPSACLALLLAALPSAVVFAQMPPTQVVVAKAEMKEWPATSTLVGTIYPARRSKVSAERAGRVVEMPARQGDPIEADGVLCRLNDDTMRLGIDEQRARLGSLKARLDELLAGSRSQELERAKANFEAADATYRQWKFEMDRVAGLYEGRDSNDKEFRDTEASVTGAEWRRAAAEADWKLAQEGPRKETIAQARFDVAAHEAVLARMESDLAKMTVRSPFAGFVVERMVEVGEWVAVGGNVAELVDVGTVLVRVDVPETALQYVSAGQPAKIHVDALKRTFEGTVKHILRQAAMSARTFPVEIEVVNKDGLLAGGMFAKATVTTGEAMSVPAVPKDAIVERSGTAYIATLMPGPQGLMGMPVAVTVGADIGDWVEITSPNVRAGMDVIVRGNESIRFPMPVVQVDERGTPIAPPPGGGAPPAGPSGHGGGT